MEQILNIEGDNFTLTLWDKVVGKERVYIKSESGKEYGYWDVQAGRYIHTGKAFASRRWNEDFHEAVNAWGAAFALPSTTIEASAPTVPVSKVDTEWRELADYALKNLELSRSRIMDMDIEELRYRVQHDL